MKTDRKMTVSMFAVAGLVMALAAASTHAAEIVGDVGDLDWNYSGGASEASTGAGSLTIQTSKNSAVHASLPAPYELADGQTMTVTLTVQLNHVPTDGNSTFDISLSNSTIGATSGTLHDSTYNYKVQLNPLTTGNGIQFAEGNDANLGKFNEATAWGTAQHTITFQIENIDPDMELSVASATLSPTTRKAKNDVTPVQTTTFDTVSMEFRGNAWNEDAGGGATPQATITDFSIETTGTVVPEPAAGASLIGLGTLLLARRGR